MKTNKYKRISIRNSEYGINLTLKDEIRYDISGQYSIYTVSETSSQVVKIMNLSDEFNYQQFQQEVLAWSRMREEKPNIQVKTTRDGKYDQFPNIVDCKAAFRQILKDTEVGLLVLENCPKGSLNQICDRLPIYALKEIQIMRIIRDILQGVYYLHSRQSPLIHRNLTMENIMLGEDNNYKITNFSNVTTHRHFSISNDEYPSLQNEIKKHTTEGYRAPEQIHLQSGYPINEKVDIFAVGVVLFILCFQKKPFDSAITTLNTDLDIPDFPKYSSNVISILKKMLGRDPDERPTSSEILQSVLQAWPDLKIVQTKTGLLDIDIFKQATEKEVKPTMINKFKKMITLKLQNKKTKGWIMASLEENEQGPKQKYMRLLIIKAWQKTDKIEKFYDNFNQFLTNQNLQNTILTLKSLILLHNYIKKGPPEALISVGRKTSAVNVLKKIIETWQNIDPSDDSKDKKRSIFTTKLINMYSQRLKEKMNLCVSYSTLIEGNFSLKPFFDNMNKNFKPLTHKLIEDLLKYMASLINFSTEILSQNVLMEIQISLMIQLVDEMYCLLCAQTHLLVAFITSTNYLSKNIDHIKLMAKVKDFKLSFERNFESAKQFFRKCQNALSQSSQKDFIPTIDSKVVEYIKNLPCMQVLENDFNLFEFLNYKKSIFGIKLPLSYGATIQTNSQSQSEEMKREMENMHKKPPPGKRLIVQLDDQNTTSNSNSNSQDTKETTYYDFQKQFKKKSQIGNISKGEKNLLSDQDNDELNIEQDMQGLTNCTHPFKNKTQEQLIQNHLSDQAQMMTTMRQNAVTQSLNLNSGNIGNENQTLRKNQSNQQQINQVKKNYLNSNSKNKTSNSKGDYLIDDEDDLDDENRNLNNNQNDSYEEEDLCPINENNLNYNDILEDDDQENLYQDFTHQSLNRYQFENTEMPQNIDKYKNINFIEYNEMSNGISNQLNNQNQYQQQNSFNNFSNNAQNQGQQQNQFEDEFHDFNNFQNFGLKQSHVLNVNNHTANNSFHNQQTQSNFNDFFQFDNSNSNRTGFAQNNFQNPPRKISQPISNSNSFGFNQLSLNRNQSVQNSNQLINQSNKNNSNQQDFNQFQNMFPITQSQKSQTNIQIKFEFKENNKIGQNPHNQTSQSQHIPHSQSCHNGAQINNQASQKQQQGEIHNNLQIPCHTGSGNRPGSQGTKSPQEYFGEFNFVNQSTPFNQTNNYNPNNNTNNNGNNFPQKGQQQQNMQGGNQQQTQHTQCSQNKQLNNNYYQQQNKPGQQHHYNQTTQQQNKNNAEEFDVSEMVENHKAIELGNASIKRNDLNQLNQMTSQVNATHINQTNATSNNQMNDNLLQKQHNNNKQSSMASVNSAFSSNNENLIELKNFIINRVKHDPKQLIVEYHNITFGKKIGSGHSGKVFQGVFNNVDVAIKEMEVNLQNERNQKEFQREIETLVKISPQINLVSLIGVAQKKDNFYIITELCNGGTMFDLLHRKLTTPLPWLHRVKMCKDIATGMIYLHSLDPPIIHRDLKSLNLLLDVPYQEDSFDYNIKIADFGLARTESKDEMTQVLGTFVNIFYQQKTCIKITTLNIKHWMAPEVFENKQYTIKADVYSYAIVLWEFISRKTPYQKMSTVDIMKNVCEGKRPTEQFIPNDCPPMLIDLMKECWEQDPNKRPDFKEVLERLDYIQQDLNEMRIKSNSNASRPPSQSIQQDNKQSQIQKPQVGGYNQQQMHQQKNYQQQHGLIQQQQPYSQQQQQNISVYKQ